MVREGGWVAAAMLALLDAENAPIEITQRAAAAAAVEAAADADEEGMDELRMLAQTTLGSACQDGRSKVVSKAILDSMLCHVDATNLHSGNERI